MTHHLSVDFDRLQAVVTQLADRVVEAVEDAAAALAGDTAAVRRVLGGDPEIDRLENRVQELALVVLALRQPVARDLRWVTAAVRVATDLERAGDLAEAVAGRAGMVVVSGHAIPAGLREMADQAAEMVRAAATAFTTGDAETARRVIADDDEVDRLNDDLVAAAVRAMKESPDGVDAGIALFTVVRHLERIADHATNIAEAAVFLAEGVSANRRLHPGHAAADSRAARLPLLAR